MPARETDGSAGFDPSLLEELEQRYSAEGIRRRKLTRYRSAVWLAWVIVISGAKRLFDFFAASILLTISSPILLWLYCSHTFDGLAVLRCQRLGRWGTIYEECSFPSGIARRLPTLVNVWWGDMSLIGPRSIAPGDVSPEERLAWKRFNTRPGLLCLWWIRTRTNIAYGTEAGSDAEYVDNQSFMGDIGIALRAVPAALYGDGVIMAPDKVHMLGIEINNLTMDEALKEIMDRLRGSKPCQASFVNADCANIAWSDLHYREILGRSELVLADGIGIKLAGRVLNRNIRQNVNGTDLIPRLCTLLQEQQLGIYLLGGRPGVAEDAGRWMTSQYPDLKLSGVRDGYFSEKETAEVLASIRDSGAALLLVAMGVPKQERWIDAHLRDTGVKMAMGVGGLLDFYSGRIPRAPAWVREMGMEWLFRFYQEPKRMWKRYFLGNVSFLRRVLQERSQGESI